MAMVPSRSVLFGVALLALLAPCLSSAAPLGSAFTYQGQLKDAGQPANGVYDMQVCLFVDPSTPTEISCIANIDDVPVTAGVFSVVLDFGVLVPLFTGEQRYLEIRVRPGASAGAYTTLTPRQLLRASPEALHSASSDTAPWSGLSGVPAGFADGIDNTGSGTVTSVATGTGLTGGPITGSGSISIANGGVGSAQINPAQVQARINGSCALGYYLRGVNADGSVLCTEISGANVFTAVNAPGTVVGSGTSIAIGNDGLPVISFKNISAGTLVVAKCANAACTGEATITTVDDPVNSVGGFSSIAIGADGFPVISYHDDTAKSLKVAKCIDAACTGAAIITTVDDPDNQVGEHTSIAIGNDGRPVISYYDDTAKALKVARCFNANCTGFPSLITVDDPVNWVGYFTSIAIGNDGFPVVSYWDFTAKALKVAKCANVGCTGIATSTITTVDDPVNQVGEFTSLAIGVDGFPVISYHDSTGKWLKVAKCINAACTGVATITTVDTPLNDVGQYTSIAIGTDGFPVIAYQDYSSYSLKVAKCVNAACTGTATIATVDDPPNIQAGQYISMAIGSDGLPVISHRNSTDGILRVVKCGSPSCR